METKRAEISEIIAKYGKVQNLINYVNPKTLKAKYKEMPNKKASGVDKVTREEYDGDVDENVDSAYTKNEAVQLSSTTHKTSLHLKS